MKNGKKLLALATAGVLSLGLLASCASTASTPTPAPSATPAPAASATPAPAPAGGYNINVCFASEPETMDPNLNRTVDGAVMAHHLFEGLYKWVENPDQPGNAIITPGQAAKEPDIKMNDDGTCTYTFTLRDDIKWSDGQPVKAQDFVYSWQRLADPATAAPYNYMINMVVNANAVMAGEMTPDQLGVSAPDDKTFVVNLNYNCPYFLEVCAFPTCFPIRQDIVEADEANWFRNPATYISNGPYKMTDWTHQASITMAKNENYYDVANLGPDSITFKLMDDQRAMLTAFNNGELDYMQNPPTDEVATLLASGSLIPGDYLGTYYACFNNSKAPFDDPKVRQAFSLAIDRNYIVDQVTQVGEIPAGGWVPNNIYDVAGPTGDDFRTVGGDYNSVKPEDYQANCDQARALLAEAGYPNGEGFPLTTYLYNTDNRHNAVAEALQQMWKKELGVEIKLDNQDWNVFLQTRTAGEYNICRNGWITDYNDPLCFLDMFMTGNGNNDAHYSNADYDALISEVMVTSDAAKRMELMHQAEDLLMGQDAGIAPLFYYTQPYLISDNAQGMFYTPLGYFFFMNCKPAA